VGLRETASSFIIGLCHRHDLSRLHTVGQLLCEVASAHSSSNNGNPDYLICFFTAHRLTHNASSSGEASFLSSSISTWPLWNTGMFYFAERQAHPRITGTGG
jgi:hypothetical protein